MRKHIVTSLSQRLVTKGDMMVYALRMRLRAMPSMIRYCASRLYSEIIFEMHYAKACAERIITKWEE